MDTAAFLKAAKIGIVTVRYTRVDTGEIRSLPGTLCPSIISVIGQKPIPPIIYSQSPQSEYLCVWAIDRAEWRDFKVDTVIDWFVGESE